MRLIFLWLFNPESQASSLATLTVWVVFYSVGNLEDRFSCDEAFIIIKVYCIDIGEYSVPLGPRVCQPR